MAKYQRKKLRYEVKYQWQMEHGLLLPVHRQVFEAVRSGRYHDQSEIAEALHITKKYAGKTLSQLRAVGLIDKVWVTVDDEPIQEDKNVDL